VLGQQNCIGKADVSSASNSDFHECIPSVDVFMCVRILDEK